MASESLATAHGEHVMRPASISDATSTYRRDDTCKSPEVFHAVIAEGTPGLSLGEPTKGNKAQFWRQPVEYAHVLIVAGWRGTSSTSVAFERLLEAPPHQADSAACHQDFGPGVLSLMSPKRPGSLSKFGNGHDASGPRTEPPPDAFELVPAGSSIPRLARIGRVARARMMFFHGARRERGDLERACRRWRAKGPQERRE